MSELNSPFLDDIRQCKSKSKTIRKKIYKYMTSQRYHRQQKENQNGIHKLILDKELPTLLLDSLHNQQNINLHKLDEISFEPGVMISQMKLLADKQEKSVSELKNQYQNTQTTAKKSRRALREIKNSTKRKLFLPTTVNRQQQEEYSIQEYIPEISMFKQLHQLEVKQSKDDELFSLKEALSLSQGNNGGSNRSSELFEAPPQLDPLEFM